MCWHRCLKLNCPILVKLKTSKLWELCTFSLITRTSNLSKCKWIWTGLAVMISRQVANDCIDFNVSLDDYWLEVKTSIGKYFLCLFLTLWKWTFCARMQVIKHLWSYSSANSFKIQIRALNVAKKYIPWISGMASPTISRM